MTKELSQICPFFQEYFFYMIPIFPGWCLNLRTVLFKNVLFRENSKCCVKIYTVFWKRDVKNRTKIYQGYFDWNLSFIRDEII
jgi:hypothetical protein